jgi:hypothetical protein
MSNSAEGIKESPKFSAAISKGTLNQNSGSGTPCEQWR